jgi:hypothetical protein
MSNIVKLEPVEIGESFRFDPDQVLEDAKGEAFTSLAILGMTDDGEIWITGNANAGEILVMMEMAKRKLVFGED